ncbi:CidA/LrgA family protein [uncultured Treponema sp.]|uniref:CidA/LrgA family protein n=1 Tax=uncultured Treponema sp. TaxID=162155 RepID=UPI002596D5BE|nr:CidA/LrgA family protein [uncultured Treponema sp.]
MKFLVQFLIIVAVSFAGEILNVVVPLPIPASIYGIVILFVLLQCRIVKVSMVREASSFLIGIMPVLFIPAAVGLVESWVVISGSWIQYLVITLVTTVLVMGVSGAVTQFVIRRAKKRNGEND